MTRSPPTLGGMGPVVAVFRVLRGYYRHRPVEFLIAYGTLAMVAAEGIFRFDKVGGWDLLLGVACLLSAVAAKTNYVAARYGTPKKRPVFAAVAAIAAAYSVWMFIGAAGWVDRLSWSYVAAGTGWVSWLFVWQVHARLSVEHWIYSTPVSKHVALPRIRELVALATLGSVAVLLGHLSGSVEGNNLPLIFNGVLAADAAWANQRAVKRGQTWKSAEFGAIAAIAAFHSVWYFIGAFGSIDRVVWSNIAVGFSWVIWLFVWQIQAQESVATWDDARHRAGYPSESRSSKGNGIRP